MNTIFIVEHIIVMGPVIETYTQIVSDETEGNTVFDKFVNNPVEVKNLTRLFGVDSTGLREIRSQGSWE